MLVGVLCHLDISGREALAWAHWFMAASAMSVRVGCVVGQWARDAGKLRARSAGLLREAWQMNGTEWTRLLAVMSNGTLVAAWSRWLAGSGPRAHAVPEWLRGIVRPLTLTRPPVVGGAASMADVALLAMLGMRVGMRRI